VKKIVDLLGNKALKGTTKHRRILAIRNSGMPVSEEVCYLKLKNHFPSAKILTSIKIPFSYVGSKRWKTKK